MSNRSTLLEVLEELMPDIQSNTDCIVPLLGINPAHIREKILPKHTLQIIDTASRAISRGSDIEATNLIVIALISHPERAFGQFRRSGLFRCSKYGFRKDSLEKIIKRLLKIASDISLTPELILYLQSVSNLLRLGPSIHHLDSSIRRSCVRKSEVLIKTIVAFVDSIFMSEHNPAIHTSSDNWRAYPKEELAAAASYILNCFDEEVGITDYHLPNIDGRIAIGRFYQILLVKACKIRCFREMEILVDIFAYSCTIRKHTATVEAPNADLEKSIKLGFVQGEMKRNNSRLARIVLVQAGASSLHDFADHLYDTIGDRFVKLVEWPVRRYVFSVPVLEPLRKVLESNDLFVEEQMYLDDILDSEMTSWEELKTYEFFEGVSVFDIVKFYRLFFLFKEIVRRRLLPVLKDDQTLALQSIVPILSPIRLQDLAEASFSIEKFGKIFEKLTWQSGLGEFIDMQYRPILRGDQEFIVPLNILGTMNWYRNLSHIYKKRAADNAEEEASSRALYIVLKGVTEHVRRGFKTKINGRTMEIDVICRFGSYLFVFECKHSALPTDTHELRTSYDHMKKATVTLNRIVETLSVEIVEKEFYRRLGWNMSPAKEIVSCIVSCNGMFPGLTLSNHPVRRWGELRNIIECGIIKIGNVNVVEDENGQKLNAERIVEHRLWDDNKLTPEFLREYIKGDWLKKRLYDAMVSVPSIYQIGDWALVRNSFALDANRFEEGLNN